MHKISKHLKDFECYFTPFYCDGLYKTLQSFGLLDFTIIGGQNRQKTEAYLRANELPIDYAGAANEYDLILTCTDLLVQKNIRHKRVILVQEGMTDPEGMAYHIVRRARKLGVPLWLASTSTTGLSDAYVKFCVASDGYRDLFLRKGVQREKIEVTGIPNFDNAIEYFENDFPYRNFVLVCTSDTRENFKPDFRKHFIRRAVEIANGRQLIFKLHPNEKRDRSESEIAEIAPGALVLQEGNASHMVANADVIITQYSTLAYVGLALQKEVHSYFDVDELRQLLPLQNGGKSAQNIAEVCKRYL